MRILDGRDYFYQWDLNVFIVSEDFDTESEVHFENKFSRGALSLKATTLNGQTVVEVPNIMLQLSTPIKAYQYIQDEYGHRTIKEKVFEVKKRAKPVDYIYTEVESLTVSDYVKKALEEAKERGELSYTCKTYADYAEMVNELNAMQSDVYVEGQDIRILTLDVPDLWVAYVDRDFVEYTYTDDNAIIEALNANGFIKIGYYRLGALETQKVDLLDYVKNTDYATQTAPGLVKINSSLGLYVSPDGQVSIVQAANKVIDDKANKFQPITPYNLDYAVKTGITTNTIELTEDEKAAAREWLGTIKKPEKDIGGYVRVPIVNHTGADSYLRVYATPLQYALAQYREGGVLTSNTPIEDIHVANKKYVDDALGDIESALDELHTYAQSLIGGDA